MGRETQENLIEEELAEWLSQDWWDNMGKEECHREEDENDTESDVIQ